MAAKKTQRDGFQLVKKGRKRPSAYRDSHKPPQDTGYDGPSSQDIVKKVTACRESMRTSLFYSELQDILRAAAVPPYEQVVCYGIGHIGTSHTALVQFSLLLELAASSSQLSPSNVLVFDPVLHKEEMAAITDCGCQLLPTNEVCKRTVKQPTLFYMPHCGRAMYNNMMWANWSVENLTQVALIGNTLSSYRERVPTRQLETEATYIYRISGVCVEYPLPSNYPDSTVFNDLSLHLFPRERLTSCLTEREWTNCPEPHIDLGDPEIIS